MALAALVAAEFVAVLALVAAVLLLGEAGVVSVELGAPLAGGCVVGDCDGAGAEDVGACAVGEVGGWGSGYAPWP